jgi:hypothetical protein
MPAEGACNTRGTDMQATLHFTSNPSLAVSQDHRFG